MSNRTCILCNKFNKCEQDLIEVSNIIKDEVPLKNGNIHANQIHSLISDIFGSYCIAFDRKDKNIQNNIFRKYKYQLFIYEKEKLIAIGATHTERQWLDIKKTYNQYEIVKTEIRKYLKSQCFICKFEWLYKNKGVVEFNYCPNCGINHKQLIDLDGIIKQPIILEEK